MLAALCTGVCKGVGDVGPKFGTHLRVRGAREYFILLVLEARGCLLILHAHASHGSDPIEGPGA